MNLNTMFIFKELRELQLIETPNDSNIDDCENELVEYNDRKVMLEQRIRDQRVKAEGESPEYRQVLEDLAQARQRLMQKREEAEQCKVDLQTCDALKENGQRAVNELQRGFEESQRKLEQQKLNRTHLQQKVHQQTQNAEKLLKSRPEGDIDVKALRRSLDALLKFIETNKNV